ncbi:uncharacterized protein LOC144716425 [Wolffia australiana]
MLREHLRLGFQAEARILASSPSQDLRRTPLCNLSSVSRGRAPNGIGGGSLLACVGKVVRTLNWNVVKKMVLSEIVRRYGRLHAMQSFGILLAVFSSARMLRASQRLCRKIIDYHKIDNVNAMVGSLVALVSASRGALTLPWVVSSMIKAYADRGMVEEGVGLLRFAKDVGTEVDSRACNFMLKCVVERGKADLAWWLFSEMKNSGPSPNLYTFNIMVSFFSRKASLDLEKAREILIEMETKGFSPSEVSYCSYLQGLCHGGESESAWAFLRDLVNRRLPCNTRCFNAVLQAFCQRDQLCRARDVVRVMGELKFAPDLYSYSILIDAVCRNGNLLEGINLLEKMESAGIKPSLVSYSSILFGLCKIGQMDRAVEIFERMKNCGYDHDEVSYAIVLDGHCKAGNFSNALDLIGEMVRNNQKPDLFHYNSLISVYSKAGRLSESLQVIQLMKLNGVSPNAVTCTILADGFIKQGFAEESLRIVDEHRRSSGIINNFMYGVLISGLCKNRRISDGWVVIKSMEESGLVPDAVIYSTLIEGFAKFFKLDEAFGLFGRMMKHGIPPNVITYTSLINGLCKNRRIFEALAMFREMGRMGIKPDVVAFTSIIDGLCRAGDVGMAWRFYEMMMDSAIHPDVVAFSALIDGFCRTNQMDKARVLVGEMRKAGVVPNLKTYSSLIYAYCRNGQRDEAAKLFQKIKNEDSCGLQSEKWFPEAAGIRETGWSGQHDPPCYIFSGNFGWDTPDSDFGIIKIPSLSSSGIVDLRRRSMRSQDGVSRFLADCGNPQFYLTRIIQLIYNCMQSMNYVGTHAKIKSYNFLPFHLEGDLDLLLASRRPFSLSDLQP